MVKETPSSLRLEGFVVTELQAGRWLRYTARDEHRLVAWVVMSFVGTSAQVSVAVAPPWRGCGIGPAFVRAAIDAAYLSTRDNGFTVDRVWAQIFEDNAAALRAAEKVGFSRTGKRLHTGRLLLEWRPPALPTQSVSAAQGLCSGGVTTT